MKRISKALLAASLAAFGPAAAIAGDGVSPAIAAADSEADKGPVTVTVDLVVRDGRLAKGPSVVRVKTGDRIVLRITSDADDELHVHGYDLHAAIKAGQTAVLDIPTRRTGRFTYELHRHDVELGALEIYPR